MNPSAGFKKARETVERHRGSSLAPPVLGNEGGFATTDAGAVSCSNCGLGHPDPSGAPAPQGPEECGRVDHGCL
eukprot:g24296.t1